eukprot:CAMPEP_0117419334 /NCGR_PEP_ID=MMETSP0758-20121206/922_1 /TAXON_ID=63605 /ORGANISM="Percolomonas cosmopolitus, Strain AE-1 (ATCC 50343)" /LENGTH=828 /DNA_ID=CAMNT_0005200347 /DNA_START=111 /DNA_END=2597 /DNA_ORIENTATION=+
MIENILDFVDRQINSDPIAWAMHLFYKRDKHGYAPIHLIFYHYKEIENLGVLYRYLEKTVKTKAFQVSMIVFAHPLYRAKQVFQWQYQHWGGTRSEAKETFIERFEKMKDVLTMILEKEKPKQFDAIYDRYSSHLGVSIGIEEDDELFIRELLKVLECFLVPGNTLEKETLEQEVLLSTTELLEEEELENPFDQPQDIEKNIGMKEEEDRVLVEYETDEEEEEEEAPTESKPVNETPVYKTAIAKKVDVAKEEEEIDEENELGGYDKHEVHYIQVNDSFVNDYKHDRSVFHQVVEHYSQSAFMKNELALRQSYQEATAALSNDGPHEEANQLKLTIQERICIQALLSESREQLKWILNAVNAELEERSLSLSSKYQKQNTMPSSPHIHDSFAAIDLFDTNLMQCSSLMDVACYRAFDNLLLLCLNFQSLGKSIGTPTTPGSPVPSSYHITPRHVYMAMVSPYLRHISFAKRLIRHYHVTPSDPRILFLSCSRLDASMIKLYLQYTILDGEQTSRDKFIIKEALRRLLTCIPPFLDTENDERRARFVSRKEKRDVLMETIIADAAMNVLYALEVTIEQGYLEEATYYFERYNNHPLRKKEMSVTRRDRIRELLIKSLLFHYLSITELLYLDQLRRHPVGYIDTVVLYGAAISGSLSQLMFFTNHVEFRKSDVLRPHFLHVHIDILRDICKTPNNTPILTFLFETFYVEDDPLYETIPTAISDTLDDPRLVDAYTCLYNMFPFIKDYMKGHITVKEPIDLTQLLFDMVEHATLTGDVAMVKYLIVKLLIPIEHPQCQAKAIAEHDDELEMVRQYFVELSITPEPSPNKDL